MSGQDLIDALKAAQEQMYMQLEQVMEYHENPKPAKKAA